MKRTNIDCIRHGEPIGGRMYRGSETDHELSETGWNQMQEQIDQHLRTHPLWDVIVTSPLSRCADFAAQVEKQFRIPLKIIDDLKEADYGNWEGLTPDEVKSEFGDGYWDFYADPVNARPQGAEGLDEFSSRVTTVLNGLFETCRGQHILLISHAGTMRAMIADILQLPLASQQQIMIPYAGMIRLIDGKRGRRVNLSP